MCCRRASHWKVVVVPPVLSWNVNYAAVKTLSVCDLFLFMRHFGLRAYWLFILKYLIKCVVISFSFRLFAHKMHTFQCCFFVGKLLIFVVFRYVLLMSGNSSSCMFSGVFYCLYIQFDKLIGWRQKATSETNCTLW